MGKGIEKSLVALVAVVTVSVASVPAVAQDTFTLEPTSPTSSLKFGGVAQFRYSAAFVRDGQSPGTDTTIGFEFRRLRFRVRGDTAGGRVRYFVQTEANNGDWRLFDAWAEADLVEGLTIRGGQFLLPFQHENLVANYRQLAQERSIVAFQINPTAAFRSQGLQLRYTSSETSATLALTDGTADLNRPFTSPTDGEAITFRLETAAIGTLAQFSSHSAPRGTSPGLLIGGAVHTERRSAGGDRFAWTTDVSYQSDGFSAGLAASGHIAEDLNLGPNPAPEHAIGIVAQAGLFLTERVEAIARYEWATTSDENHPDLNVAMVGINWYIAGNALRFSADANYVFDELGPSFARPVDGFIADFAGQNGEVVLRAQLQFLF